MKQPIYITAIHSISPMGDSTHTIWNDYLSPKHFFSEKNGVLVAKLPKQIRLEIEALKTSDLKYKSLDYSVLFAIYSSRKAVLQANWQAHDNFGINMGSSRGATQLFESFHEHFLKTGKAKTLSSPTTTLGNISSWVANDLQTKGPEISHSITCSTALHALLNGVAWLNSGMCSKFMVGGSEAAITPFTLAQMRALKIYAKNSKSVYPCRAMDLNKTKNSMILGEAASVACLEKNNATHALATIIGLGYATETLEHNASLSTDANCFQRSMAMAIGDLNPKDIDIIVTHTPGTVKGDQAEYNAITKIFGKQHPFLTNNKWKLGHTFAVSGMLNLDMAITMLQKQQVIPLPFLKQELPKQINHILINAVGFGGNAVSVLISK